MANFWGTENSTPTTWSDAHVTAPLHIDAESGSGVVGSVSNGFHTGYIGESEPVVVVVGSDGNTDTT